MVSSHPAGRRPGVSAPLPGHLSRPVCRASPPSSSAWSSTKELWFVVL